jgi:hypothetical protein
MHDESFAWDPRDAARLVREHNERVLRRATEDEFAKAVSDAHFEALLENAARNLRATNDTPAIQRSNERWRMMSDVQFVQWLTGEKP